VPLSQASLLIPLITGAAETALDKKLIADQVAEIMKSNAATYASMDRSERIAHVKTALKSKGVTKRAFTRKEASMKMEEKALEEDDMEEAYSAFERDYAD